MNLLVSTLTKYRASRRVGYREAVEGLRINGTRPGIDTICRGTLSDILPIPVCQAGTLLDGERRNTGINLGMLPVQL